MQKFSVFSISSSVIQSLNTMNIMVPTPIQEQAIPLALEGHDVLASAQTGTGKTMAYLIPLITRLIASPEEKALVVAPTRELATQVKDEVFKLLANDRSLKSVLLIGGDGMALQCAQLHRNPRIIIGTPGRIIDHLQRGTLRLDTARFFVLDEIDRMLDMGFKEQIDDIVGHLPEQRQTLMFSATLPHNIVQLSNKYLINPKRVSVGSSHKPTVNVQQEVIHIASDEKFARLLKELNDTTGSVIIFVKTKHGAEKLSDKLNDENHASDAIHGDLRQRKREQVIRGFRNQKHRIMVATDVAARGLDVPHIEHVINYDMPQCPEDYVHRIGRTGRAGAQGKSLSLVSPEDVRKWKAIYRLMNPGEALDKDTASVRPQRKSFSSGSFAGRPRSSYGRSDDRSPRRSFDNASSDKKYTPRFSDRSFSQDGNSAPRNAERSFSRPARSGDSENNGGFVKKSYKKPFDGGFIKSERSDRPRSFERVSNGPRSEHSTESQRSSFSNRRSSQSDFVKKDRPSFDGGSSFKSRSFDRPFKSDGFKNGSKFDKFDEKKPKFKQTIDIYSKQD